MSRPPWRRDAINDDPFKNSLMGFIDSGDTMILGANTYAQTNGYWPTTSRNSLLVTGRWARRVAAPG
jgi:hypothetical protein